MIQAIHIYGVPLWFLLGSAAALAAPWIWDSSPNTDSGERE